MDLETVRMFVKVAELASFTRAGEQLGLPKSRVSLRVKQLEAELDARLLQRTTRAVRLTPDGEQFLARAKLLVLEADELATMFQATSTLRGRVRIDLPTRLARDHIFPRLPDFLAQHPQLELLVSTTDRRVEVVREGFDCVLRVGALGDSRLLARRIGVLPMANYASPEYLRRFGTPRSVADLDRHLLVHYSSTLGSDVCAFEYRKSGRWVEQSMRSTITVNNTDAYEAACLAGLGIIQAPRIGKNEAVERGRLVEILPNATCEPMPVSLVHSHGKKPPQRVREVMAFLAQAVTLALAAT